ncbi:Alba domain-containing protein [Citrus sinensis]|uniref:Alba domain-containing protein n=1 Tax=Citrus sinensis TaxID=2711 RepID=A0ACB8I5A4_CITSI|nr:Alba domain-containing protein [Citrus sinensis]
MESSVTVAKSSEFIKAEESKNENKHSGSKNKKVATVAVAVVDSGDGKNATTGAAGAESSSVIKKTKKKKDSNRILVSHTKKPFVFYLDLAKNDNAIPTVVTIAEALKRDGLASNIEVKISTVNSKKDDEGRFFQKAKIQIVLGKAEKLEKAVVATTAPKETSDTDMKA